MPVSTRDAKNWLESVILDESDMSSDSHTDVASQASIKSYTDTAEADAIASANGYTDSAVTGLATEGYVDTAEADAISSANGYTDSAVSGLATTGYVDTAEADAISSANGYTDSAVSGLATTGYVDTAEADAISSANGYTDSAVSGLATTGYVDTAEADAISSANGYTDSAVSGLATTGYVDTAESDAISSANGYTDSAVSGLATTGYVDTAESDAISSSNSYTDTHIASDASSAPYVFVEIDNTDSPYSASFGEMLFIDDVSGNPITINMPQITGSDYGKRVIIAVRRISGVLTIDPYSTQEIYNKTNFILDGTYGAVNALFNLVAIGGATINEWIGDSTPAKLLIGDTSTAYPDNVELMRIGAYDNTIQLLTDTTVTGSADGLKVQGQTSAGLSVETNAGNAYLVLKTVDAATAQIKLQHTGSGNEWRITHTANTDLFQLRANGNTQSLTAAYSTGNIGLHTASPGVNSPIRVDTSLPVYSNNATAIAGGLTAGELYKTSAGVLMVTY